ncbi:MAG TPA: zinc ribbon domain-containing protein [Terriglobales bacterium]|nr:zinc ribbon domain-containing protein [Terriglobales bacterium]
MGFCTNCGNKIDDAAQFCTGCGTRTSTAVSSGTSQQAAAAASPAPAPTTPVQTSETKPVQAVQPVSSKSGGSAVKIILIVVAILVGLGILSAGIVGYLAYKAKKSFQVSEDGATVSTPWGTVTSNNDASKIAQDLGVEVYPGAKALEGASAASFGNVSFGSADFETSDSIDKVEAFYKSRFPKSTMSASTETDRTLMVVTDKGWVTVVLEQGDGVTKIRIARTAATGEEAPSTEGSSGSDSE